MNDPDRKIEIDKSSLLSLKAELLRKQEEVSKAKATSTIDDFVPKHAPKNDKNSSERSEQRKKHRNRDKPKITELEDSEQLARSKRMLATKAKYYDRMVASGGALNSDENSLVMFNKKKQDTKPAYPLSEESAPDDSSSESNDSDTNEGTDGKWVEYVDCLGRTRKCLKEDLETCLERDKALAKAMAPREGQRREDLENSAKEAPSEAPFGRNQPDEERSDEEEEEGEIIGPMPSTAINETNIGAGFREMRQQWMQQEEANLEKDSIHYQDVLFDEARLHGVGYYGFSTDQQERNRQRDELDAIRESTIEAQKVREELRTARDRMIADRVKAARARQRARQGLPPEDEAAEEERRRQESEQNPLYDTVEEERARKAADKQRKKQEKAERRRERERAQHVRPWDEGKEQSGEDREWVPAKERFVLSQHEWNDLKRSERIAEFAPPSERPPHPGTSHQAPPPRWQPPPMDVPPPRIASDSSPESSDEDSPMVGPMPPPPVPAPAFEDIPFPEEDQQQSGGRALFFTTKKQPIKRELKRRNLHVEEEDIPVKQVPVPIRNELLEDAESTSDTPDGTERRRGAEIEPPPTYDYYGPSDVAGRHGSSSYGPPRTGGAGNLEASIEAGLKFLRNQSDKGTIKTKNSWTSNADY
ncbi:coiled-coil domain-containing protein 174 [Anopheles bellator]|uniref:coiled-coil domain-containing protein 174 n=1 Tax=Anopheles bellator TaxID=139047 RepID=UPI002649DC77|nr:coiled-coil domain-containing protein 174 [Anopheles bellator]